MPNETINTLGADMLWGAESIAEFLGINKRQALWKLENGLIPAGKNGRVWIASKRKLIEHFSNVTSGEAA